MKMRLQQLFALALALAMCLALAACGSSSDSGEDASDAGSDATQDEGGAEDGGSSTSSDGSPVYGGTFTTYFQEFYSEYDVSANDNRNHVDLFAESLWGLDWDKREELGFTSSYLDVNYITGNLAESWTVADDFSTITVTLRDGVTFADKTAVGMDAEYDIYGGRALTASDVKYSYDRVMGFDGVEQIVMEQTDWPSNLYMLESVEATDDATVVFHLNTDTELAVESFMCTMLNICGPEWDELTDDQKTDWRYAGGTGPFILTNYVNDNTMTFTANPGYWATDADGNKLPYLGEIKLVHVTDSATMLSSFIGGELQALVANNSLISKDEAAQLKDGTYVEYVRTNDCPAVALKIGNNPVEALTNLDVRKAMQYAIDVDGISAYQGYTYATTEEKNINLYLNGTSWYNVDAVSDELVAEYNTYDQDMARQLLADAGYADGFSFDVYLYQAQPIEAYQLAAEDLAEVGITMNIHVCSTPPEMTAHGSDPDDPASQFGSMGTDKLAAIVRGMPSGGAMDTVFHGNSDIDALVDTFNTASTLEEQLDAADALNAAYLAEHYLLLVSYGQQFSNYVSTALKGWNGEMWTQYYFAGDIFARIWVE